MELQILASNAVLRGRPSGDEKCGNCRYYLDETADLSYCWHPKIRILVGDNWWCQWWDKIPAPDSASAPEGAPHSPWSGRHPATPGSDPVISLVTSCCPVAVARRRVEGVGRRLVGHSEQLRHLEVVLAELLVDVLGVRFEEQPLLLEVPSTPYLAPDPPTNEGDREPNERGVDVRTVQRLIERQKSTRSRCHPKIAPKTTKKRTKIVTSASTFRTWFTSPRFSRSILTRPPFDSMESVQTV